MRWEEERYVRVFTRDTAEWIALGWEAQSLFLALLRKVDRAGILVLGKTGTRGLAGLLGAPLDLVERALPILVEDGCVRRTESGLVVPNYMAAQEAAMSDKARQREKRERDRSRALGSDDGSRDVESRNVTQNHEPSRAITEDHAGSLRAVPCRADLSRAGPPTPAALAADPGPDPEPVLPTTTAQTLAGIWPKDPEPGGIEGGSKPTISELDAMARHAMTRPVELTPYERSRVAKVHARLVSTLPLSPEDVALIVEVDTKLTLRDEARDGPTSTLPPLVLSPVTTPRWDPFLNAGPKRDRSKLPKLPLPVTPEDE